MEIARTQHVREEAEIRNLSKSVTKQGNRQWNGQGKAG
jgi:hypothetical protein